MTIVEIYGHQHIVKNSIIKLLNTYGKEEIIGNVIYSNDKTGQVTFVKQSLDKKEKRQFLKKRRRKNSFVKCGVKTEFYSYKIKD